MRRKFWIVLLGIGAFAGFASGFISLAHHRHGFGAGFHSRRHAEFENHIAEVCTRAAERVYRAQDRPANPPRP